MFMSNPHVMTWSRTAEYLGDVTSRLVRGLIPKCSEALGPIVREVDPTYSGEQRLQRYE